MFPKKNVDVQICSFVVLLDKIRQINICIQKLQYLIANLEVFEGNIRNLSNIHYLSSTEINFLDIPEGAFTV